MAIEDKKTQKITAESKKERTEKVKIQPAQFSPLEDKKGSKMEGNIKLLLDVPLQITAELGRTTMNIKEVLELGPGSVIELNKLAGETVDILINGKLVAQGEVVVVEENFGVRITNIIGPEARIRKLQ